jgi:hypothetical protein
MKRLFRSPTPGTAEYVTLGIFVLAYVGGIVLAASPATILWLFGG